MDRNIVGTSGDGDGDNDIMLIALFIEHVLCALVPRTIPKT